MIKVSFMNKNNGKTVIKSMDIEQDLRESADFEYVNDISNSISQKNIMVFDCKLDETIFNIEDPNDDFFEEFGTDAEYFQVVFDDIKLYIADMCQDIEHDLREEYRFEKIRVSAEIYDVDETITDVKFVLVISFMDAPRKQQADLTRVVAKRQLQGSSKYFN